MNDKQLIVKYKEQVDELRQVLTKSLSDLFQRPIMIGEEVKAHDDIEQSLSSLPLPGIALMFQSGKEVNRLNHLILFPDQFVLLSYAWMVGEEPAQQVDENHLDGLREIFNQILGQTRMAIPDDNFRFHVENLQVGVAESPKDIYQGENGFYVLQGIFKLQSENENFDITHLVWSEQWTLNQTEDEAQSEEQAAGAADNVAVEPVEFGSLGGNGQTYENNPNIEMLLDVDLEISVELDRKSILVSDLLKMGKGSIIEFNKSAGEPLDILVNGRKFAEGEVVVIDDKFGIRITQLMSPRERLKTLA
ncbi:flagellar motor switch protein FliN [Calditrichota bacterium GD2]